MSAAEQPGPPVAAIAVGASAGGLQPLRTIMAGLPPGFPADVLVVLHVAATRTSVLPQILGRVAIAQAPEDCEYASMPANAMGVTAVDAALPVAEIAGALAAVARGDRARREREAERHERAVAFHRDAAEAQRAHAEVHDPDR